MNILRPVQHVIETNSIQLIHELLPSEWVVRELPQDYGVDLEVEIVDRSVLTGNRLWIQLKGHAARLERHSIDDAHPMGGIEQEPQQFITFPADVRLLNYAQSVSFPLLLVVADLQDADAYWVPLRDEIDVNLDSRSPGWRDQQTASVRIPAANSLRAEANRDFAGLRRYAQEPARFAAFGMLHAILHELGYEADLSYTEHNDTTVEPGAHHELFRKLDVAKSGLQRALAFDAVFGKDGEGFFGFAAPQLEAAVRECDAIKLAATADESSGMALGVRVATVSQTMHLISTAIASYMESRIAWVTYESNVSVNPLKLG